MSEVWHGSCYVLTKRATKLDLLPHEPSCTSGKVVKSQPSVSEQKEDLSQNDCGVKKLLRN